MILRRFPLRRGTVEKRLIIPAKTEKWLKG
jgi:hypothetical protein